MSWSLSFGNNWRTKLRETPRACISQESCHVALGNKLDPKKPFETSKFHTDSQLSNDQKLPPLVSALKSCSEQNASSFHFPGHNRGRASPPSLTHLIGSRTFQHDLPELPELDNLFSPEGPILEAQKKAAEVFGASETWFLVGGSTCGIQAAIMATCSPGDTIILPRNLHISAVSAMVLSGAVPKYIVPEYNKKWDIAGGITPLQVDKAINELELEGRKPAAVLVISPSYHGICSDISAISTLCHAHKIPLIVDEAHGAHFAFYNQFPKSALSQGADLVVQSTHKVLCSLTQSSMLHASSSNLIDRDRICRCLQTLQSSSPSYLLLASLDAATHQISEKPGNVFNKSVELAIEAKNMIKKIPGISLLEVKNFSEFLDMDPLRVTIGFFELGLSGFEADEILYRDFGVVVELVGTRSITLAFNLGTKGEHVLRFLSGLKHLSATFWTKNQVIDVTNLAPFDDFEIIFNPREAFFARKRRVGIEDCVGEICGELICPYPPGIPVLIPGEIITDKAMKYMLRVKSEGAGISGAADSSLSSIVVCDA